VDKIGKAKAKKGESEQWTSTKPSTAPYSPSTNWLSQMATNKAQTETEGHKAKKSRMMKVKESLQSPNTDGRNQSSSSSSVNTLCGVVSRPQERAQLRNEDNTAGSMKKRRLEVEEDSLDSLRLLQSKEQSQVDRMQERDSPIISR
jgi:hypothetical protein